VSSRAQSRAKARKARTGGSTTAYRQAP
jgi:hypothetical protein